MGIPFLVWLPVVGYEGLYEVSDRGDIYSKKSNRILNAWDDGKGYTRVELFDKHGNSKQINVHRIVAEAFLPNPDNLPYVNHKDENKANNNVSNLEWCTPKYNTNYGDAIRRRVESAEWYYKSERCRAAMSAVGKSRSKPVMQFDIFGNLIAEYPSASEASRATGIHISNIFHSCKGRTKHPSQFIWKYKEV